MNFVHTKTMKTKKFIMRVTEKEFAELKKRAGKMGLTVSAFVRLKALYEPEEKKGKK